MGRSVNNPLAQVLGDTQQGAEPKLGAPGTYQAKNKEKVKALQDLAMKLDICKVRILWLEVAMWVEVKCKRQS